MLGLACAYLTLCIFFYLGQWQFVLHPAHEVAATPSSRGLAFEAVRFGDDVAGQPLLTGWFVPAATARATVLLLHSESGSMSDALPTVAALHQADLNVLVFDYRGYGQSGGGHPTERSMMQDAEAARAYLREVRHVPADRLTIAGVGLGASLATQLGRLHSDVPALILINADGDTESRVDADQRSRIVPIRLLFHEKFPLGDALHTLATPKLLVSFTRGQAPEVAQRAADPKVTEELAPSEGPEAMVPLLTRFLDQYVPR